MPGHQPYLVTDTQVFRTARHPQHAVLVGGLGALQLRSVGDERQTRVDRKSLEPGVDDRAVVCGRAHHGGPDIQALRKNWTAGAQFVATIIGVHENVRSRLQLGIDPAVALEQESTGSRAGHRGTRYTRALDQ